MKPGPRNLITDVGGLKVGNAGDARIKTGVTVLLGAAPFVASVDVMGGAPGTRETDLLAPDKSLEAVDALVLAGGSAFGLDAASGVTDALRAAGRGFEAGGVRVPIVPAAILFDLLNGGDKRWTANPYHDLGIAAFDAAAEEFELGSSGAGTGATTANLKGGLGSASLVLASGVTVGALAAVNATGRTVVGDTPHFWAAPFEVGGEFGGAGPCRGPADLEKTLETKQDILSEIASTTLVIVATDAMVTKAQCARVAVMAQDGLARAIVPSHTPVDGDIVFALSTSARPLADNPFREVLAVGHAAAVCVARAVARAVFAAREEPGDVLPTWQRLFGQ
ncbi:MAG TPA: P1 family peptidase [Devosiaceae bacterium]|nr:P1 family peptidase [Devosiaceae bacterium]